MSKSLLEQLPGIVAAGKRQAAQILEQLEGRNRVSLQTRELVIPSKAREGLDLRFDDGERMIHAPNRLIYGDNLLAMAALLAGDEDSPSLRGKIDLIYIDPRSTRRRTTGRRLNFLERRSTRSLRSWSSLPILIHGQTELPLMWL